MDEVKLNDVEMDLRERIVTGLYFLLLKIKIFKCIHQYVLMIYNCIEWKVEFKSVKPISMSQFFLLQLHY